MSSSHDHAASQFTTAHSVIRSGLSLQLFGLCWGFAVQATPYPRLALTAHINLMAGGAMVLLVGIVLLHPSLIQLSTIQSRIVYWGLGGIWLPMAAQCANAFWGTNQMLPIAAMQAGAKGGLAYQEQLVKLMHMVPAVGLTCALGVLVYESFARKKDSKSN